MNPLRAAALACAALAVLAVTALIVVWGISEREMHLPREAPLVALRPATAPDLAEGGRMARIIGCLEGCHGRNGEGGHEEIEGIVRHVAPTLSQVLPDYTDDELVRLVRYGVKRDGKSAVGMISYTFWALGDQDLANIMAFLRGLPPAPAMERTLELSWRGRWSLVTGEWKVSSEQVEQDRPQWGNLPQPTPVERGRYLASVTCSECHGLDFHGNALEKAPTLAVIGAYSEEQFRHLIRTAEGLGGRTLDPNMRWVADAPFADAEIVAIYRFLRQYHGFAP